MMNPIRSSLLVFTCLIVAAGPPPAPTNDYSETLFGMTFRDTYRWMEAGGHTFDDWLSAEANYTRHTLDLIPGRAKLFAQIRSISAQETIVGRVTLVGNKWIYAKTSTTDPVEKIFVRSTADRIEHILIDPSKFDSGGMIAQIDYWRASPDGRHIAYGVSLGGSETGTLRIRDVTSGVDLAEKIDRTRYASPSWIDNFSFLYTRLPPSPPGKTQRLTGGQIFLHRLGRDPDTDLAVFGPSNIGKTGAAAAFFFHGLASPDSPVVVGEYDVGLGSSPQAIYVASKSELGTEHAWHQLVGFDDEVRDAVLHGDTLFLRISRGAPQQRIVRVSVSSAGLSTAETVLPEGTGSIDGMIAGADALYVSRTEGGVGQLVRIPWGGQPETIPMPYESSIVGLSTNLATPGLVVRVQGWTRSQTVFRYRPDRRDFIDTGIAPPSPTSFEHITTINLRAPARDGVMIPVTIMARRGLTRGESHPVLMYTYGAYGVSIDSAFNATRRVWLDRGGIYALVHVRGSGGFGEEWHRAGRLANKINSINDFVDAARYLVDTGWARPAMLSCVGESAGGIVVGGAIAVRPDLFSAALIRSGLVNALRLEHIPIGAVNTTEFGSTETEEGVQMLYAIDAYQQLREGVAYPGVLLSTGRNDPRVSSWMSAKFAARLQAVNVGTRPVLLQVSNQGGHFIASKEQLASDLADFYSFLLWQAGVPSFQPRL